MHFLGLAFALVLNLRKLFSFLNPSTLHAEFFVGISAPLSDRVRGLVSTLLPNFLPRLSSRSFSISSGANKNRDISRRKQVLTLVTPVQGSQVSSPISTVRNLDRNRFRTEFVSPGPSNTFEFFQLLEPTFLVS